MNHIIETKPLIETVIESLNHEGRGVAHINGKVVFIHNALPGETVRFRYIKKHRAHDEAVAEEIITPSADRVMSLCPHYNRCGGCSLQHLSADAQIAHKQAMLLEQLKHFGEVVPKEMIPPLTGPITGYRHKARLGVHFTPKKNMLYVGFREKNGRYIADIETCSNLHPSIGQKINTLRDFLFTFEHRETIPQIEVAIGDDQTALVIRHLEPLSPQEIDQLREFAQRESFEIYLQPKKMDSVYKLWPEDKIERLHYALPDHQIDMQFHPCDFTQVNPAINRQMVTQAIEWLKLQSTDTVLDLFCGLGNFTLAMSRYAKEIVGVEVDELMIARGQENAKNNQCNNVNFYAANLFEPNTTASWFKKPYNKILLDPPRSGAQEIIQLFPTWPIEKIVYVSCNPATFARDAGILVNQQKFKLVTLCMMDMFPHTTHVEVMGLFVRR